MPTTTRKTTTAATTTTTTTVHPLMVVAVRVELRAQTHSNVSALSRARGEREKERKRTKLFSLDNGTNCDHHHRYHNRNGHQSFWRLHTLSSFSGIFTCSLILLHTLSTIFHHHYFFFYYFFFSPFSPFRFALVCARVARQKTQPKQTDSSLSVSVFSVRVLASSEVEAV